MVCHWNVAGLAAMLKSEAKMELLHKLVAAEAPDVLALSEHKLSEEKLTGAAKDLLAALPGYSAHWAVSTAKKGYSVRGRPCPRARLAPPRTAPPRADARETSDGAVPAFALAGRGDAGQAGRRGALGED